MKKVIRFPSVKSNINFAEKIADEISDKANISTELYGNILVALMETITNAVIHGNKLNPNKFVEVTYSNDNKGIKITVADEGNGFDFNNLPDPTASDRIEEPNGRGVFLIKKLADMVNFELNGRKVILFFKFVNS